jgi:hypothetical protein
MPDRCTYRRSTSITAQSVEKLGLIPLFLFNNF